MNLIKYLPKLKLIEIKCALPQTQLKYVQNTILTECSRVQNERICFVNLMISPIPDTQYLLLGMLDAGIFLNFAEWIFY